jgi:hypothetical protein
VDNSPRAIAAAVESIRQQPGVFRAGAAALAEAKRARWSATREALAAIGR